MSHSARDRSRRIFSALVTACLGGLLALSRPAQAADESKPPRVSAVVEACVDHHTDAQKLRMAGKLLESRLEMRACAAEECPALLQRDCLRWLDQIETQIPSVTFRVTVDGQSRTDGRASIDGTARPELTTGKAIELDPGKHRLRFVLPGLAPFEEEFVSSEGERYRMLEVALSSGRIAPQVETHRPVPVASYVLGGVAVAAAITGGILGASSLSLRQELEDTCAPACPDRRVDALRRRALFTDLSWGVSAVSLLGAATFFVLRPELPVEMDVSWLPGGGMGRIRLDAF
jgi:hypothetical protein